MNDEMELGVDMDCGVVVVGCSRCGSRCVIRCGNEYSSIVVSIVVSSIWVHGEICSSGFYNQTA